MLELYTDGACSHNKTWHGGWGYVIVKDGIKFFADQGNASQTTNNRMELEAVIQGLTKVISLKESNEKKILIYSDSAYFINCMLQKWYLKWEKNGWKNYSKKPVENKDLWEKILSLIRVLPNIEYVKVKGHDGNQWNEYADALANGVKTR